MPSGKDYGFPDPEESIDIDLDDLSSADGAVDEDQELIDDLLKLSGEHDLRKQAKEKRKPKSISKEDLTGPTTFDDIGNAEWLLSLYPDMRWDYSIAEWVIWDGEHWKVDSNEADRRAMTISRRILKRAAAIKAAKGDDDDDESALEKWGRQCGNLGRIKSMLEVSKSMPGISVPSSDFNSDGRVLACPNGVLVLGPDGAKFRATSKEDMATRITGCEYDPKAKSSMWEQFLDKFLPDPELRIWAQQVAGYSMFGGNPSRKIVFCLGPTSSGKSTFAELIKAAMGTYSGPFNLSMLRENQEEKPRPDLVMALPQRIIFASEAGSDWHLHNEMIKRVTGQDEMLARLPHSGVGIRKIPDFTPWIITNSVPTIKGADQALYRRLCTVLFPETIADGQEDEGFRRKMVERGQLPGVLAWMVEGWNLYCDHKLKNPPDRIVNRELNMRESFSDLDVFISEACEKGSVTDPEYREVPSTLYEAYEEWADRNGVSGRERLSSTAFGRALSGRGFEAKAVKLEGKKSGRRRLGLRLKVK